MQDQVKVQGASGLEIAVVGMAGRFPGAADTESFWKNLRDGVESVTTYTDAQLRARGVAQDVLDDADYVKAGVAFDGFDQFDASFFGYTPREAEYLDPQHRIFLECAWEALESAGYDTQQWPHSISVFAGSGANLYLIKHLLPRHGLDAGSNVADLLGLVSGNAADALCTRVAYKLNLRGPAVTVQTACSTSLAAVHMACQSLLAHECEMALAGGVSLNLLQNGGYHYQPGAIFSPDGHCRAFDADAAGTMLGSGAGIVVLRRLEDALRDGDTIHAVIKGTAANNDGADKIGFTAPSVGGQSAVIRAAQLLADVPADSIGYIEAHGTGTTLGDPIEVAALAQAFAAGTQRRGFCALGSVKTNVGHLDCAAGVTGLIKTVLALKHRTLPASLHFERPNPKIDFDNSPFYVNATTQPWHAGNGPLRAGVSAFGIGGTNVHAVLEEAPAVQAGADPGGLHILPLSAMSSPALRQAIHRLADHLQEHPQAALADVAFTLQVGRRAFAHRVAVVADRRAGAVQALLAQEVPGTPAPTAAPEVVFVFPGGGSQHANMGAALYRTQPVFREEIDRCCEFLQRETGMDLRGRLFPAAGQEAQADEELFRISVAQPALFVVNYAMARLWMSRGVQPALMLGHSLGEYVAACLAGVFSLEDALRVVAARGRLLQSMGSGAMTAIALSESQLQPFLVDGCDLAAVNGEQMCVLSGPLEKIEAVERALAAQMHVPRRLHVSIASHSAMAEPVMAELERVIAAVPRHAPRIPFISNVTGTLISPEQAISPRYWAQHLRSTVRFADGLGEALGAPGRVVLEVGPGDSLTSLSRQHALGASAAGIWASQAHVQQQGRNELQFAHATAHLWTAGVNIDWAATRHADRRPLRVPLPTYPFQRRRFWVDADDHVTHSPSTAAGLLYAPCWKRTAPLAPAKSDADGAGCTLILGDANSFTDRLAQELRQQGRQVVLGLRGQGFARIAAQQYTLRAGERADHETLLRAIEAGTGPVVRIFHLWSLDGEEPASSHADAFESGFFSLLALAQALDASGRPLTLTVITDRTEDVAGTEALAPEKATVSGIAKVLGQEYPHIACRVLDLVLPVQGSTAESELVRRVVEEAASTNDEFVVAYRGPHRWVKAYEPVRPDGCARQRLRRGGVYLITGGMGGVGLALARYLTRTWQARLVLLGRTPLPARGDWERLAAALDQPLALRRKLQQLIELEASGAQVMNVAADVTDPGQLREALAAVHERFGAVNGVVHAVIHPERGMIAQRTRALVEAAFAPKVAGTLAVLEAMRDEPLDFVLFCSSIATLIGGLGRSDYAAANAYLDALAHAHRRLSALPVFSVNWDAWRDVGAAADMDLPEGVGLDERTGVLAFERIVNGPDLAQTVVSTSALAPRLRPLDAGLLDALEEVTAKAETRSAHARPALETAYVAPAGELEEGLAELWREALGIEPVGAHDNLFELGGDSLLAIRLLAKVRKSYGVELHPADFFKAPTIGELAALVELRLIEEIELDVDGAAEGLAQAGRNHTESVSS